MLYYQRGSKTDHLSARDLKDGLYAALDRLGSKQRVLIIPPDFTRFHSRAGELTRFAWEYYGNSVKAILPATGTHFPMTREEIHTMYTGVPPELFREHNWREDVITLGEIPADTVRQLSAGKVFRY